LDELFFGHKGAAGLERDDYKATRHVRGRDRENTCHQSWGEPFSNTWCCWDGMTIEATRHLRATGRIFLSPVLGINRFGHKDAVVLERNDYRATRYLRATGEIPLFYQPYGTTSHDIERDYPLFKVLLEMIPVSRVLLDLRKND
jgi:hypothetical protein